MKKLLALILCLFLCLPALADSGMPNLVTVDFGPFTMSIGENDYYGIADTMTSNAIYAEVYKDYYLTGNTVTNMNVIYSADDIAAQIASVNGIENYGKLVLHEAGAQLQAAGYVFSNAQLQYAQFENNIGFIAYSYSLAAANAPEQAVFLHAGQVIHCRSARENYIFSLTSNNEEEMEILGAYVATVAFKDDSTAATEKSVVDFGTFTLELGPNDHYEIADEMTSGAVYTIIRPNYDPNAVYTSNINLVWDRMDYTNTIKLYGPEKYAQMVQEAAVPQYESMNIKSSNIQVLRATLEDDMYASIASIDLDYTGAGVDLVTTIYQMQVFFFKGAAGTYAFTATGISMEELETFAQYIDSFVLK